MLEEYRYIDKKKLRCGYTTGTCAAAAAMAAAQMLLGGTEVKQAVLTVPKGIAVALAIERIEINKDNALCAVRKDAGDDPDVTNGIYIYARAEKTDCPASRIEICGGQGIGRVTRPGLDQPVGEAAINTVPRRMIREAVFEVMEDWGYEGSIRITISAPEGKELAEKTFNPRLGIEGGISILGTSGIVEPMSETALLETIYIELNQRKEESRKRLVLTPGNYGMDFMQRFQLPDAESCVKCSNFIGQTLDKACELGFEEILLVGHIGKLVKLGAGVMNTHSRMADARMETMASCVLLAGGSAELASRMLGCITADEALEILQREGMLEHTMQKLMERIEYHLRHRVMERVRIGVIVFSNQYGILGSTEPPENYGQEVNSAPEAEAERQCRGSRTNSLAL